MAGCQKLVATRYLDRHNKVTAVLCIHMDICKYYRIDVQGQYWYEYKPDRVVENDEVTINIVGLPDYYRQMYPM